MGRRSSAIGWSFCRAAELHKLVDDADTAGSRKATALKMWVSRQPEGLSSGWIEEIGDE